MIDTIRESLDTPVRDRADVLVVGGGVAGVAAAVAARRQGRDVLLLEKTALFGGLATNGLISWYEPLCDGEGTQLTRGLAEELLRMSIRYGPDTLPAIWRDKSKPVDKSLVSPGKQDPVGGRYGTFFSPTMFQLALDELLRKEGIRLRLNILGVTPVMEGNICRGVITESLSGREAYLAQAVIDATGDAVILNRAGVPTVKGANYFSFVAHLMDTAPAENVLARRKWRSIGSDLFGRGHPEGRSFVSGTTNEEETAMLLEGRGQLLDALRDGDRQKRDVTALPQQAQFRKTRRLDGAYTLTEKDRKVPQARSVAVLGDFANPGLWYELPYECLYHPDYPNLAAAGRMVSSDGWAWDITRVIPGCAASGEAAGVAAAMAAESGKALKDLDIAALQKRLRARNVCVSHEEALSTQ